MMPQAEFQAWVQEELGDIDLTKNGIVMNCINCTEKETLRRETLVLNDEISYLTERVASLRSIRDGEHEINTSINNLANQLDELQVDDTDEEFNEYESAIVDCLIKNITIVDNDTTLPVKDCDELLDTAPEHTDTSQQNRTSPEGGSNELLNTSLEHAGDPQQNKDVVAAYTVDTLVEENNRGSTTETSNLEQSPLLNFRRGNHVKTLILGDSVVKNLLLVDKIMKKGEYFRIANTNANLEELIENALFFMQKFLFGVSNIILQISFAAVNRGRTERMKEKLSSFIQLMNARSIKVTICGPIPYGWMNNETFSRAYSMTKWLCSHHRHSADSFGWVDCFELLWKHEYAFMGKRVQELSSYGNWLLEVSITDNIILSD